MNHLNLLNCCKAFAANSFDNHHHCTHGNVAHDICWSVIRAQGPFMLVRPIRIILETSGGQCFANMFSQKV